MTTKSRLLDPIGTAFKIILLNFEPENTRITINDHVLELEPPDITQFITRWWYGESREDICCLTNTVVRFIEFYIDESSGQNEIENSFAGVFNGHDTGKKNIKQMAKYICDGLEKLEQIYKMDNAALTLAYYRLLLKLAIDGKYNNDFLPIFMKEKQNYDFINSDKLREIWDESKLDHICDLYYKLLESHKKQHFDICNFYLRGIKEILQNNDIQFRNMINGIK
jgi:hypothetical protein